MYDYDLIVIGSGPAGHNAAIEAAKSGKRVAIVDRTRDLGGVCLHTGTIPSKTLREAALYLSGFRQRTFYGRSYRLKARIQIEDLMLRVDEVIKRQYAVIEDQFQRSGITVLDGFASFTADPHVLEITSPGSVSRASAQFILIACGTRPARRDDIPFDSPHVHDSDEILKVTSGELPRSAIVVGGGVIGLEYASMVAALGVETTVVELRDSLLTHVDHEITEALMYLLRGCGVTFRLGEKVVSVTAPEGQPVSARLESGKVLTATSLLYAVGRQPNTDRLGLPALGLGTTSRGHIEVNQFFQTSIPHVYAAGDVVGFPSLASTSMEQGRLAACHMFGLPCVSRPDLLPFGIYTIPEISLVGKTEQQLTADKVPYEVGIASFHEIARAQISGDQTGMLKLIFHVESLKLLGVHIIGEGAVELIHVGQTVMMAGETIHILRDTVFNYPSLAEAYRVAAAKGLDKLRARTR